MAEQNNGFNKSLILIGAIILIILVGGASYFYTTSQSSSVRTTNSTMATSASANVTMTPGAVTSSENMTMSTSANATTLNTATNATTNLSTAMIQQNATTQDYHMTLRLGPPAQILSLNQTVTATAGEVMVNGQMSNTTSMNMTDTYHLEVHVYNITSGAVVTNQNVSIQILNHTTNQTLTVPVIVMYDMKIGPSDTYFGNNITLPPGSYTIMVNIAGETATFNINVTNQ